MVESKFPKDKELLTWLADAAQDTGMWAELGGLILGSVEDVEPVDYLGAVREAIALGMSYLESDHR